MYGALYSFDEAPTADSAQARYWDTVNTSTYGMVYVLGGCG